MVVFLWIFIVFIIIFFGICIVIVIGIKTMIDDFKTPKYDNRREKFQEWLERDNKSESFQDWLRRN